MNVTFQESILYYDCELIFTAVDEIGQQYVAAHTGDYETGCEYIVAQVSPEILTDFKAAKSTCVASCQILLDRSGTRQHWT